MNNQFDELSKGLARPVARRRALKKHCLGFALGCATLLLTTNSVTAAERSLMLKGDFDTKVQVLPPFPSFPPGPFQPLLHLLMTATGNLSHFGRATAATADQAVDLSVNPNHGTAHWVFQNPKGDVLVTEMDLKATVLGRRPNNEDERK